MRVRRLVPALVVVLTATAPAAHAFPGANGRIAFTSKSVDNNTNIFTVAPTGGAWAQLTTNTGEDAQPTWSPDGTRIAFRSIRGGRYYETYVMNADGSDQHALTVTPNPPTTARPYSTQPSWSPDGTRIVFRSNRDGDADIWTMAADGSDVRQVADLPGDERYPSYSPDGTQILFQSDADGDREIYLMNLDGTNVRQLTNNSPQFDSAPTFSPDGGTIAFERADEETSLSSGPIHDSDEIWVMNPDGSNQRQLTFNTVHDEGPSWAPDGTRLAFTSERENTAGDIWTMGTDGSEPQKVAATAALEESPDWQALAVPKTPAPAPAVEATTTPGDTSAPLATPPDTRAPNAVLSGPRRRLPHRQAAQEGVRFRLRPDEPARAEVRLFVNRRPALAGRIVSTLIPTNQTRSFTIRLTRAGRLRISRTPRLTVVLRVTLTDAAGNHRRLERPFTISR